MGRVLVRDLRASWLFGGGLPGAALLRRHSIHHPLVERLFRVLDGVSGAIAAIFRFRLAAAL